MGFASASNFIATILPHKQALFASKFELVCQRLASHKGMDLDHLIGVPLAFQGKFTGP